MSLAISQLARISVLKLEVPGREVIAVGVLLEDPVEDRLYARLRRDWDHIAPEEAEILSALEDDLRSKADQMGAARLMGYLQDTLSNFLLVSNPKEVVVEDFGRALARLYRENVRPIVLPFVTHLPLYSLAVAAGKLLDNQEVTEEGWEEAPPGLRARHGMFVARIHGRSMEPLIPDGSLCVFRAEVTGQGRLVLVEALGRGSNDRYTVKRYRSEKSQEPEGQWRHKRIRLEPLNPDFEAWDLEPEEDTYRILAEFVQVLD